MRFRQRHRWLWLALTVVTVLLAHLAVAQLTLAHEDGERGRERPQQAALVSASREDEDDEHEDEHEGRDHAEDDDHEGRDDAEDEENRGRDHPEDDGHVEDDSDDIGDETGGLAEAEAEVDGLASEPLTELTPFDQGQSPDPAPALDTQVTVTIANSRFQPSLVTVPLGGTVTWTSVDRSLHTATSDTGAFDSGLLRQGESFSQVFEQAGTYTYICDFHDEMRAAIVVSS